MTTYRTVNEALQSLCGEIINQPVQASRNGPTRELLFRHFDITQPLLREILIPERKASLPAQIAETMWVLAGRNDIAWLENYLPRAGDFSDDGKTWRAGYGPRIRAFGVDKVDQLEYVVETLQGDPNTRRAVIGLYDPTWDTFPGKDIACNNWLHFLARGDRLDLHVATRSNDLIWGWSGINAFEWSVLLEVVASLTGLDVGQLHFSISSLHVYEQHWDRAERIAYRTESLDRSDLVPPPRLMVTSLSDLDREINKWFTVEALLRTQPSQYSNNSDAVYRNISDPMLRSWLHVLGWWWSGDERWLDQIRNTRLEAAAMCGVARPESAGSTDFVEYVTGLHSEKHAVYGDSWKKRGELIGIMANIARKIDRLGVAGAGDTSADTAIDLLCYLAKYRVWLTDYASAPVIWSEQPEGQFWSDSANPANEIIAGCKSRKIAVEDAIRLLKSQFDHLEAEAETRSYERVTLVQEMIPVAFSLARWLWQIENWKAGNDTRRWKGYGE